MNMKQNNVSAGLSKSIPLVYFPFTVLFVDDDTELLKIYTESLSPKYNVRTVASAPEGLSIINDHTLPKFNILTDAANQVDAPLVEDTHEFSKISVAFDKLLALANNKEKYTKVGIAVVDYQMPNMNGIELCDAITNQNAKKVLLTGEYDLSRAVTALNNKQIDCFIRKGEKDTMKDLAFFIAQLKDKYFEDLTKCISTTVIMDKWKFLKDPQYIEFFNNIVAKDNICEYYFIDNNGNFLLINDKSEKSVLVRYDNESLDEFCNFFGGESKISGLINAVKKRELIPYFGINKDPMSIDLSNWDKCFYKANKHNDFYWNVVKLD